jgi:transcription initiation factor TFIIF subunit beta
MADQPQIKPDPDAGSPFMDEALDETPDLDFYDKLPEADKYSKMYLARLPTYVWQAWSKLDDDAEIEIGKIRQSTDKDGKLVSLVEPWGCCISLTWAPTFSEIANAP